MSQSTDFTTPSPSPIKKKKRQDTRKRPGRKNPRNEMNCEVINRVPYPRAQVEALVSAVEERTELWEKGTDEFSDIFLKAKSWDAVARIILVDNGK